MKVLICDTAPCLRHTSRITPGLPWLFWHGVELSWKLSCTQNGPVVDEIRRIRVHRQNIATAVVNYVIYVTAARSRRTSWIFPRLPRLRWHVVGLSLKLWCTPNGPVLDGIRRILVHPQNNQIGFVNEPTLGLYEPKMGLRCRNSLFATPAS